MIRRPPRSTRPFSSAASDVYKRQIYRVANASTDRKPTVPFSAVPGHSNSFCRTNSFRSNDVAYNIAICRLALHPDMTIEVNLALDIVNRSVPKDIHSPLLHRGNRKQKAHCPCFSTAGTESEVQRHEYDSSHIIIHSGGLCKGLIELSASEGLRLSISRR